MAKKRKGESTMGYFKKLLTENKAWLQGKSNDEIFARYLADHGMNPDAKVPENIKNSLGNVKSVLRKEFGGVGGGRKKKSIKVMAAKGNARPSVSLETLEDLLDECLLLARTYGLDKSDNIVRHVRIARNAVVVLGGEN